MSDSPDEKNGKVDRLSVSEHIPRPANVLGSIRGQRSRSGTEVEEITMVRTLSETELDSPLYQQPPTIKVSTEKSPEAKTTTGATQTSSTGSLPQAQTIRSSVSSVSSEEEDEEIRMAKAMAFAIQQNPNLSPDAIRSMVGAPKSVVPSSQQQTQALTAGQYITNMFQAPTFDLWNSTTNNTTTANPTTGTTTTTTTTSVTTPSVPLSQPEPPGDSQAIRTSVHGLQAPSAETGANSSATKTTTTTSTTVVKTTIASGASTTPTTSKPVRVPAGRNLFRKSSTRSSPRNPPTETTTLGGIPHATSSESGSSDQSVHSKQAPQLPALTLPTTEGTGAHVGKLTIPTPSHLLSAVTSSATSNAPPVGGPIKLATLAWKRRGGMGKFSTTSAWELRRIELTGTRICYYRNDAEAGEDAMLAAAGSVEDGQNSPKDEALKGSGGGVAVGLTEEPVEGVVVNRRTTWLEQAAANWATPAHLDPTVPRGFIDLVKEKATVQASLGHTGAPSPFAISIKVRGETKWKLCFDYHKTQMEWLAAITDIVVQNSVDAYNASLLAAADPANQVEGGANALFQPPSLHEPPASGSAAEVHRLWMMGPYTIDGGASPAAARTESDDEESRFETDDDDASELMYGDDETERSAAVTKEDVSYITGVGVSPQDHAAVRAVATEEASKTWLIPEKNLSYLAILANIALCYARASSTTTEAFWYLVVATNFALYFCLVQEPDWRSVLQYVRADTPLRGKIRVAADGKQLRNKRGKVASAPITKVKETIGYIPEAGSTTVKIQNPTDPPINSKNDVFAGWREGDPELMLVRSHGYSATKRKVSSPGELYECVAVEVFESPSRYPDMAKRVKLPKCDFDDGGSQKTWRSPDIFVISIALPTDPPKIGRSSSDGGGFTITMYYRMHKETREILKRVTADGYDHSKETFEDIQKSKVNAVRLLEEWVRRAPSDPKFQARFKVVPNAHNLKEIGMPSWISKYNGKPFLIKRCGETGFLHVHPELSCVEFDVSLHPFPYLAKQGICFMKDSFFKKILVTFGFCIEGRTDDELPECLLGMVQLCYPDPKYAIQAKDFFAGTSPRSSD